MFYVHPSPKDRMTQPGKGKVSSPKSKASQVGIGHVDGVQTVQQPSVVNTALWLRESHFPCPADALIWGLPSLSIPEPIGSS